MKYLIFTFLLACVTNSNKVELPIESELVDLEYLVRKQHDTTKRAPLLVLLHGYGSNEEDLFSLSDKIPDNWLLVSVRAPIGLGSNRYKWYDVKLVGENIKINFEDEEKSRQALL
jgi:phospholipase/carboxylesterase